MCVWTVPADGEGKCCWLSFLNLAVVGTARMIYFVSFVIRMLVHLNSGLTWCSSFTKQVSIRIGRLGARVHNLTMFAVSTNMTSLEF